MDFIETKAAVDHRNGEPYDDSDEDIDGDSNDGSLVDDDDDYDSDEARGCVRELNSNRLKDEISKEMIEAEQIQKRAKSMSYVDSTD